VRLATGDANGARSLLRRRLLEVDQPSLDGSLFGELAVETEIALGARQESLRTARTRAAKSAASPSELIRARGRRALGRALLAIGESESAVSELESALAVFTGYGMPLEAARTRLLIAAAVAATDPGAAIAEARAALQVAEDLGAVRDADEARAILRSLGIRPQRAGLADRSRAVDALTRREVEVLALLGEGLSNTEIAERLFITRRTVEHHVASVLSKTGVSGRGAAAAYAVRHLERGSAAN
jgi:DNA-binding NarL/FixJ family response regulator